MNYYRSYYGKEYDRAIIKKGKKIGSLIKEQRNLMNPSLIEHQENVSMICIAIASYANLTNDEIDKTAIIANIHDVGKTSLEHDCKRRHHELGKNMVVENKLTKYIREMGDVILYHHELYDGSGPEGKLNRQTPLMSKIIGVADKLDHLLFDENRKRNENLSLDGALKLIEEGAGNLYDPFVVDMLLKVRKVEQEERDNTLQTLYFGKPSNAGRLLKRINEYKGRGWKLSQTIDHISNEGISTNTLNVFANFAYEKEIQLSKTFENSNIHSYHNVIKNHFKGTIKLGKKGEEPDSCVIVYTKKILEDFKISDFVVFKGGLWNISWVDKNRYMLTR